jgi:GAF domain-containing protein
MSASGTREAGGQQSVDEQLRQREAEIRMLLEVNRLVGSEYNLQKVFDQVAESARGLIDAHTVTIPILSDDQHTYTYRSAVGENADELLGATLPIEVGICGWVLRNHKPWWRGLLEELNEQERNQWEQEAGSIILVPLIGHRRFLGGIAGINKHGGGEFEQRDYDLLSMFASQVSIAIENAMFVDQLDLAREHAEAYREKLEALNKRLKDTNVDLQRLAVLDPLSGLPNRTLIMDRLEQALR